MPSLTFLTQLARLELMKLGVMTLSFICLTLSSAHAIPCRPEALGTARTLAIDPNSPPLGLKTYPHTLALADHELVLTFDDGPYPPTTRKILDALKAECVQATFFLIGQNAKANPNLVRRALAEGHSLGHHSMTHPLVTLRALSDAAAQNEVTFGMAADEEAAGWHQSPAHGFFRYPGFADTPKTLEWLREHHYVVFGADLWASDWLPMSAEQELALLLKRIEAEGKGIVLLHDIKAQTAAMLPALLRELKARGYKIVHIEPASAHQNAPYAAIADAPAGWHSETEAAMHMMMLKLKGRDKKPPAGAVAAPPSGTAGKGD
jgi:peptidoglycan-N-acetylglucosamine deacetylase